MTAKIDTETIKQAQTCKFSKKCMDDFDNALCCKVVKEEASRLYISPVSTFKSSNCSHKQSVQVDNRDAHICTCPVRMKIYKTLGK